MAELPSGTVTFLFTDLEGSTRMWDEHPDAMRDALARHDAILRQTVTAHDGHVVKSTGDGVHAVFDTALDAVGAAAGAVRALSTESWDTTGPLRIRTGIHSGSAEARDGDYFGPALNRAARLMASAHGGQVVLSQVTADLVRDVLPDGLVLRDLGEHRFRGIARPERVHELEIVGMSEQFPPLQSLDAFPGDIVMAAPSFARAEERLAGRGGELGRLLEAWERAGGGTRQVAFVSGEPGIGKTRLVGELSSRVHDQDGVALYGRCDEEAIVACQPFVEALRPYVAASSTSLLHERLRGLEQDLARAFPELSGRIPVRPVPLPTDPDAERYRFFEAINAVVTGIAATRTTLLVLDDLHWADKPTLLLLRHLVRSAPRSRLLVVVCYRDAEVGRDHPFADVLAGLRRERFVSWVPLAGLSASESGALLSERAGAPVAAPLAAALHRETGGNPFFLEELVRHLVETQGLPQAGLRAEPFDVGDLPESVREVLERRLRRLPDQVNDVLQFAALLGSEFDAAFVGQAAGQPSERVLQCLDEAADARVVVEDPARIGRYLFAHALIRQTLTSTLGRARRAQIHAQIGAAMEAGGSSDHPAAELARHFTQAVPLVGATQAIAYTTSAGHRAVADLAFEDAVGYFERALDLLEQHDPAAATTRVELLTDLANALVYVDERAGVEAALRAVDAARQHGSPVQFGRAVAVFVEPSIATRAYPTEVTNLFDEARTILGDDNSALRARLLAFEAFKYATYQLHGREARTPAHEAVAIARDVADAPALADALFTQAVTLEGTPDLSARTQAGEELVRLGRTMGARESAFGLKVLAGVYLELGDAARLTSTIDQLARIGIDRRWVPAQVYAAQWRVTQALLEGRFDDARTWGDELRRSAMVYRGAAGIFTVQAFQLARELGELGSAPTPAPVAQQQVHNLYLWAMLAIGQLEGGEEAAARRSLDALSAHDFHGREPEIGWPAALAALAEITAHVGTPAHAAALYEMLEPFTGRLVAFALGLACAGSADRYLGMASTMLGRWDQADAHFARALDLEERAHAGGLLPRTRYWQARSLLERDRELDTRVAHELLGNVVEETSRLGMKRLGAQAEALLRSPP